MESFLHDVRYGARMLGRRPGFTLFGVLTLALGIGANTAIFSVVNAVLLRPLPFSEPERIVRLEEQHESWGRANLTGATFLDVRDQAQAFTHLSAFRFFPYNLSGVGEPESVIGVRVSSGYFDVLGAVPLRGRAFTPEEFQAGTHRVVILSHALWQRRFGADPGIIGRTVLLDTEPFFVVGVLPPEFRFPDFADLWLPLTREQTLPDNRRAHLYTVLGRLKPEVSLEQARAELNTVARRVQEQNPKVDPQFLFTVTSLHERMVAPVRPALLVLLGAVGFLLLIACANVANLSLARALARRKELAIRASLGADRLRLVRQLLTESLLLALAGGALGILLALWGTRLILALHPGTLPQVEGVSLDWRVLVFTAGLSLLTGLLFGAAPALHASRLELQPMLKEGGRTSLASGHNRLRGALAVSEVAIALVLLVGAGLLGRSFLRLLAVDPGYNPKNILTMFISLPSQKYAESAQQLEFYRQVLERVRSLPGVERAAVSNVVPTGGLPSTTFEIEGRPNIPGERELAADIVAVSPNAFRTLGVPLLRGRTFSEHAPVGAPVEVVINETLARQHWGGQEDPIGKRITMLDWGEPLRGEVVGVVGDVKLRGLDEPVEPTLYYSHTQFVERVFGLYLMVRTASDPLKLAAPVREQIQAVDPDQPVANLLTLEQIVAESVGRERFNLILMSAFAALAVALVLVGIYGVISYSVAERRQEIGIRLALGAQPSHILRLVVGQGMLLAGLGLALGTAGALGLTRVLRGMLFEVSPLDPFTFLAVEGVLAAVAVVACYLPARQAARIDPISALRYE